MVCLSFCLFVLSIARQYSRNHPLSRNEIQQGVKNEVMYIGTQLAPGFPSPGAEMDGQRRSGPWFLVQALRQGTET